MTMCNCFKKLFTEHPASVDETYLQHMWFAVRYSVKLLLCSIAALFHAFLPFLFVTYVSKKIEYLNSWVKQRD